MEAAGIEPASNNDSIKDSTDIVCFQYDRQPLKQTKWTVSGPHLISLRGTVGAHPVASPQSDALTLPRAKKARTATCYLRCECKVVCFSFFEQFSELLGSVRLFNFIKTVETFTPPAWGMAGPTRLELATSCVTGMRSNQLNYDPAPYAKPGR
jgi:hypothetical protein